MFFSSESSRMDGARKRATHGVHDLVAGAEDLLRATASYGGAEMERARDRLKHHVDQARQLPGRWEHVARSADGYVHEHGWKMLGAGLLLGVVVGACLISGRHR